MDTTANLAAYMIQGVWVNFWILFPHLRALQRTSARQIFLICLALDSRAHGVRCGVSFAHERASAVGMIKIKPDTLRADVRPTGYIYVYVYIQSE